MEGVLALALGMKLLQPRRRVPPPAHLCRELGTHRPSCPCSHVSLWPQSSGTGRRNHPVGWPLPPWGPLPEGQGWGTLAASVARGSRGAAAAGRHRGPLPIPAPSSRLLPAARCARFPQPAGAAAHTLTPRAPPRLPAGWGLGEAPATSLFGCFPIAAALPPLQGNRDPNPKAEEAPKSREGGRVGRQTGVRAGGGLSWLWVPREQGQARSRGKRELWLGRELWAAQAGPGAARRGCRQHRGAQSARSPLGGRDKRAAKPAEETN